MIAQLPLLRNGGFNYRWAHKRFNLNNKGYYCLYNVIFQEKANQKCHSDKRQMIDDIHQDLVKEMSESEKVSYYLENGLLLNDYYSDKKKS